MMKSNSKKESIYYLHKLTNSVFKWTGLITSCLLDFDIDSGLWQCYD